MNIGQYLLPIVETKDGPIPFWIIAENPAGLDGKRSLK
jgi:hypothetical protein